MSAAVRTINFTLNGRKVSADVKTNHNVVEMLQLRFSLFGSRESCGQGLCGCCTVLIDHLPVSGCLYLAAFLDGCEVTTVEHLAESGKLDLVQESFIECGAFQCGYCTPGFILMTKALIQQHPDPDDEQIRDYLAGNLCRCAAYPEIVNAVKIAARRTRAGSTG